MTKLPVLKEVVGGLVQVRLVVDDLAQLHDADLTEYIDELKARIAERLAINREDLFATHDYHTEQGFE